MRTEAGPGGGADDGGLARVAPMAPAGNDAAVQQAAMMTNDDR
jgi:hypothetical protein